MICRTTPRVLAIAAFAVLGASRPGHAQILDNVLPPGVPGLDVSPGVTVPTRLHPGFEQIPVRLGGIDILPSLTESTGYASNVLGSNRSKGSAFLSTTPDVVASENWTDGSALVADANLTNVQYFSLPTQTYTNDTIAIGGVHPAGDHRISLAYAHLDVNVLPTQVNFVGVTRPLLVHIDQVSTDDRISLGKLTVDPNVSLTGATFNNVVEGGVYRNQAYLNRNTIAGGVNAYWELVPQRNLILSLRADGQAFGKTNPFGPKLNNHGETALVGMRDNTDGVLDWYALVGYQEQDFDEGYPKQSEPIGEFGLIWSPTGLTTVTASLKREIEQAVQADQIGYTYLRSDIRVDHEWARNIILHADLGYEHATRQNQQGDYIDFNTGAHWLLNHHMTLDAAIDYQHYTSNVGIDYDDVTTSVGVRFGL